MSGWTKLFSSLPTSSIWSEDYATRIVWTTMLAVADADGLVEGSVPGFARLANVAVDEMKLAIKTLAEPDPYSRTPDHGGRRIEPIEGGWRILNYRLYRERGQAKDGSKAPAMRAYRERKRFEASSATFDPVTDGNALPKLVTRDPEERGERREERKEDQESPSATPAPRAEDLQQLWNELMVPGIPRCQQLTPARRRAAEARLRERGLDGMRAVFLAINESPFLRGENDRGWRPDLAWALKPENIAKVLDGNYGAVRRQPAGTESTIAGGPAVPGPAATRAMLQRLEAV